MERDDSLWSIIEEREHEAIRASDLVGRLDARKVAYIVFDRPSPLSDLASRDSNYRLLFKQRLDRLLAEDVSLVKEADDWRWRLTLDPRDLDFLVTMYVDGLLLEKLIQHCKDYQERRDLAKRLGQQCEQQERPQATLPGTPQNEALNEEPCSSSVQPWSASKSGASLDAPNDAIRQTHPLADFNCELDRTALEEGFDKKWILNLSAHFRGKPNREKFFITYAERPTQWRRLTVSLDYRHVIPGSLEEEMCSLRFQRDKSLRIYEAIRESLPDIQFYDTVTNLKLETAENQQLHVHVREDADCVIHFPQTWPDPSSVPEAARAEEKSLDRLTIDHSPLRFPLLGSWLGKATQSTARHKMLQSHRSEKIAPGQLSGTQEHALVDTGAGPNFISARWLRRHGIAYDSKATGMITRADGTKFSTLGAVTLLWQFAAEKQQHPVVFKVLLDQFCASAITFGSRFMRMTETLSKFSHRLTRKLTERGEGGCPRVFYQDGSQLRMTGYCAGEIVSALPDSCSDLPLLSKEFASRLGMTVDYDDDCQVDLELPGRHIKRTCGMIRNVPWQFELGGPLYYIDFYILEGLPADTLLDADFLEETQAFQEHEDLMFDLKDDGVKEPLAQLFLNIKLVRKLKGFLRRREPDPPQTGNNERKERIAILDKIEAVLQSDKSTEQKETEIATLSADFARLNQPLAPPPASSSSSSSSSTQSPTA